MSKRRLWKVRLQTIRTSYNFDHRIPKPVEEPKCVLSEAAQSHIIVN